MKPLQSAVRTLLLLAAALTAPATAQIPIGKTLTKDNLTAVVTYFGCFPIPGVPLGPDPSCRSGMMISVHSSDTSTVAFTITITYTDNDGKQQTAIATTQAVRASCEPASVGFPIGWHPISSIAVVELRASGKTTFE